MKRISHVIVALLLASPAFAQVPNRKSVVERVAAADPARFACAHTTASCGHDFIKALACELAKESPRWGLNGKRGNPGDLSWDALNWRGEGPGHDPTDGNKPVTVIDVIGSAGSPAAYPAWTVFDTLPGPGAWVKPVNCGATPVPIPTPTPQPPAHKPYPGDQLFVETLGNALVADYTEAGQSLNAGSMVWVSRTIWRYVNEGMTIDQSVAQSRKEWRAALGLPPS